MSDTFTFTFNETTSFSWTLNKEPYAIDMTEIDGERKLLVQWKEDDDWEIIDEKFIEGKPLVCSETELYGNRNDEYGEEIKQNIYQEGWVIEGAFD